MTPEEFARRRRATSGQLIDALKRMFLGLGSWRASGEFVQQAVPMLQGAQRELAALTAVYIADQASAVIGRVLAPPGIPDGAAINLRRGIDARAVYARPFTTVYTALSRRQPLTRAVELGATRLGEIAEMDLQTTFRDASAASMRGLPAGARPSGWRRVLVGPENCAMCVVASTQRYRIENLNPIHGGCNCGVAPLYGDVEQVIEPGRLEAVHDAVAQLTGTSDRGGRAPDYRRLLVESTAEHGELGALLVRPRDNFTGPLDLAG